MLETYVAGLSLLTTVFFEAIAVSWIYGKNQFLLAGKNITILHFNTC